MAAIFTHSKSLNESLANSGRPCMGRFSAHAVKYTCDANKENHENTMTNYFEHHVFFCLNQREDGAACCMDKGAEAAFDHMKARIKKLKLNGQGKVRINRAGCFDRCGEGPLLVVYPQAVWYTFVDHDDIDEIIDSHLIGGKVVERLLVD